MAISREGKVTKPARKSRSETTEARRTAIETGIDKGEESDVALHGSNSGNRPKEPAVINGKTYACQACKTGHRVATCTHFKTKPLTPTNPPGRPASGVEKRKKCRCACACSAKGCKCGKNCHCTLQMWVVVQIPDTDKYKLDREVITDLKGLPLDDEEVQRRKRMAEAASRPTSKLGTPSLDRSRANSLTITSPSQAKPVASGGCCKHKEKVAKQKETVAAAATATEKSAKQCNCGVDCTCGFCPEHPNNAYTTNLLRQQVRYLEPYDKDHLQTPLPFGPSMSLDMSCMGGLPQLTQYQFWGVPSLDEFSQFLPAPGGYTMAYPVNRSVYTAQAVGVSGHEDGLEIGDPIQTYGQPDTFFPHFDIGEAVVLSSNMSGQHEFLSSNTLPFTLPYEQQHLLPSLTPSEHSNSPLASTSDVQTRTNQPYRSYSRNEVPEAPHNALPSPLEDYLQSDYSVPSRMEPRVPDLSSSRFEMPLSSLPATVSALSEGRSQSSSVRFTSSHTIPLSSSPFQSHAQGHWSSLQQVTIPPSPHVEARVQVRMDTTSPVGTMPPD